MEHAVSASIQWIQRPRIEWLAGPGVGQGDSPETQKKLSTVEKVLVLGLILNFISVAFNIWSYSRNVRGAKGNNAALD